MGKPDPILTSTLTTLTSRPSADIVTALRLLSEVISHRGEIAYAVLVSTAADLIIDQRMKLAEYDARLINYEGFRERKPEADGSGCQREAL